MLASLQTAWLKPCFEGLLLGTVASAIVLIDGTPSKAEGEAMDRILEGEGIAHHEQAMQLIFGHAREAAHHIMKRKGGEGLRRRCRA